MDLISRQAAIDALMAWEEDYFWDKECVKHRGDPYWVAPSDVIEQLPSAQPERIKGHWVEIASSNHTYKCSVCGRLLVNITDGKNNVAKNYPYCHCGADMRGEQDDESRSKSNAQTDTRARGMGTTDKSSGI